MLRNKTTKQKSMVSRAVHEEGLLEQLFKTGKAIVANEPTSKDRKYVARNLICLIMPRAKPNTDQVIIHSGDFEITFTATNKKLGLPYGPYPRLIRAYIEHTVFTQWKSGNPNWRHVEFGKSAREFFAQLGIEWGGKTGKLIQDQGERFFSSVMLVRKVTAGYSGGDGDITTISDDWQWLWSRSKEKPDQKKLFPNFCDVSEKYGYEIIHAMPYDVRQLGGVKRWALAMDIYLHLARRFYSLKKPVLIPWSELMLEFGGNEYKRERKFREEFAIQIERIKKVYQAANLEITEDGLQLWPSRTPIPIREKVIDE